MRKVRLMTTAALVAIAGFTTVTLTSCEKEDTVCAVGLEGKNCDVEVREDYYNTYKGTGSDNHGGTYSNWGVTFEKRGDNPVNMKMTVKNSNDAPVHVFDVELNTNTTYKIVPVSKDGWEYSGQGSVSLNSASLSFTEKDPDGIEETYIYTFNDLVKE